MIVECIDGRFYEEPEFMDNDALIQSFEDDRVLGLFVPQKRTKTPKQCLLQFGVDAKTIYVGDTDRIFPDGTMRRCGVFHLTLRKPIPIPYKRNTYYRQPLVAEWCIVWRWAFRVEDIIRMLTGWENPFAIQFLKCRGADLASKVSAQMRAYNLPETWEREHGIFLKRSKVYTHDPVHSVRDR